MIKIAFHGVPRSGTSWIGSIFDSSENVAYRHQPLFSYAFKDFLNENSSKEKIDHFFDEIFKTDDDFVLQTERKENKLIPRFNKKTITHIVYKEARYHHILENMMKKNESIKVVGVVRNPKSVISSWYNAPKEFDQNNWNLLNEWIYANKKNKGFKENFYGYQKWKQVSSMFIRFDKYYDNKFYLLYYSKLLKNPEMEVEKLFQFCGIPYSLQTKKYVFNEFDLNNSNTEDPYSVFRSRQTDDKWKKNLPIEIINKIDNDLEGTELNVFNKEDDGA